MNFQEIEKLIELFGTSKLTKMRLKDKTFELELDKNLESSRVLSPAVQVAPTPEFPAAPACSIEIPAPSGDCILSPMVGTFYHRPSPGAAPFVKVGDVVKKGQTVGIVEAMKIMNEIEAEFDCKIVEIKTGDGVAVEFNSELIRVERI